MNNPQHISGNQKETSEEKPTTENIKCPSNIQPNSGEKIESSTNQENNENIIEFIEPEQVSTNHLMSSPKETFNSLSDFKQIFKESYFGKRICTILLSDGRLCSSFSKSEIRIYDPTTFAIDIQIKEEFNNEEVPHVAEIEKNIIVACTGDCSLIFFQIEKSKYTKIKEIKQAHQYRVIKIIPLKHHRFCTSSRDSYIKIWDSLTYQTIIVFSAFNDWVNGIFELSNNILVSGSWRDTKLIFWDLNNYILIKQINDFLIGSKNSFLEYNKKLYTGCFKIYVFDIFTLNVEVEYENPIINSLMTISLCPLRNGYFIIGGSEGEIAIVDEKFNIKNYDSIHYNSVYDLVKINDHCFASSSFDGSLIIYEY